MKEREREREREGGRKKRGGEKAAMPQFVRVGGNLRSAAVLVGVVLGARLIGELIATSRRRARNKVWKSGKYVCECWW